jgi:UDP-GlcNAc:undecaprenyl-phosphate GlcNAc-1-phosphate transferase
MGDAGSQFLGFLAAALTLGLTQGNTPLSPLLPLILFGFPILDTLTVIFERISRGRSPFMADKNHFHHRLMGIGLFHTEAVFVIYVIQAFLVTFAFIFRYHSEWLLLNLYLVFSGLILLGFHLADKSGWKLKRYDLVDKVIKGKLRKLKEKNTLIRVSFKVVQVGVPSLLLLSCFLPADIPRYLSLISLLFVGLMVVLWLTKKRWVDGVTQVSLFFLIPFVIYLGEKDMVTWMNGDLTKLYTLSFGFLVIFLILTVKFSRRKSGFQTNPMDFLILFIALVIPNLPEEHIQDYALGLVAAKVIILFFGCEVLMRELRGELKGFAPPAVAALAIVAVRGLL